MLAGSSVTFDQVSESRQDARERHKPRRDAKGAVTTAREREVNEAATLTRQPSLDKRRHSIA